MKNILIALLVAIVVAVLFVNPCNKPTEPVIIRSEKIKEYKDTIDLIKIEYRAKYYAVQNSTRPDTFIRNLTDTVFGNKDSFIYVTVLQGRECCEIGKWKDSIINEDSIHLVRSEQALKQCSKKAKSFKVWQRFSIGLGFILAGALIVK